MNYKEILERDLNENIIKFWNGLIDKEHGGFYGAVSMEKEILRDAPKGLVYISRILYGYSSLYLKYKSMEYLNYAKHAYEFLVNDLYDKEYGCFYWSTSYDGKVINDHKHLYGNSFALYGMANYYLASKDEGVLSYCLEIFNFIKNSLNEFPKFFYEELSRDYEPLENKIMEGYNMIPDITTNTILHLAESVSLYYYACKEVEAKNVVIKLLDIMFEIGYDAKNCNFYQFLDRDLNNVVDVYSYGHNIEVSWLFMDVMKLCDINNRKYFIELVKVFEKTFNEAYVNGYVINQMVDGVVDKSAIWWIQAEALAAINNMNNLYPCKKYVDAMESITDFIVKNFMNESSEWNWGVNEDLSLQTEHAVCEMWKANYHNIRAVLKILEESDGE